MQLLMMPKSAFVFFSNEDKLIFSSFIIAFSIVF